jgi:GLPGLI family protein
MQKKIYIFLLVVLKTAFLHAQVPDTAFAAASYTFLYVADTAKPADITSEKMVLYLGKHMSAYRSYGMILRDSEMAAQAGALELQFQAGGPITFPGYKNKGSFEAVYKDLSQAKLYHIEKLQREYLLEETTPVINWSIESEIKNIQGLSCQKATTHFRGRAYTAWFCSELPYDNGPWKLGGLPGLIVEASDDRNEIVFRFDGYEDVSGKKIVIGPAKTTIRATDKEFKQLREAADADPGAFIINTARPGFKWIAPPADPGRLIQKASKNPIERTPN